MTSTTIYAAITPTYLYIKQHSVTGLKYFGKTSQKDPIKYLGSGKHWIRHINKHGKEFVDTIWLSEPYIDTSITEVALLISEHWDIVNSKEWANLIPENGINGGDNPASRTDASKEKSLKTRKENNKTWAQTKESNIQRSLSHLGKKRSHESIAKAIKTKKLTGTNICKAETKIKISKATKGILKPMTQEHKDALKCHQNNKIQVECPYCNKVGQLTNMKAWHFDKCKLSPNYICDNITCIHCGISGPRRTIKRYHNDSCNLCPQILVIFSK